MLAPVIPPVIVPNVQVKVLATLAVNAIFGPIPLQVEAVAELVTVGVGFTTIVAVIAEPTQFDGAGPVGVIVKVTVTGEVVVFVNATPVISPVPLAAIPCTFPDDKAPLSLVQAKVVPATELLVPRDIVVKAIPEHFV